MAQLPDFSLASDSDIDSIASDLDMPPKSPPITPISSPRKQTTELPQHTPRRPKAVSASFGTTELRQYIAQHNSDEFLTCAIDEFQAHYLPFLPTADDIDVCLDALSQSSVRLFERDKTTENGVGRFAYFKRGGGLNEVLTFSPLCPISDLIGLQTFGNRTSNGLKMRSCPDTRLKSDIERTDNRIDACFWRKGEDPADRASRPAKERKSKSSSKKKKSQSVVKGPESKSSQPVDKSEPKFSEAVENIKVQAEKRIHVSEVVVPMEFKKKGDNRGVAQNRQQILSAAHQIIHDDVRRAWIYGITIEGSHVSLWYFSRSHCVKSQSFSFEADPRRLISVFISLQFATQQELGYDERVTRLPKGLYVYEIPQEEDTPSLYFRTVQTIVEPRPLKMTGRMTRVWEVVEVTSNEASAPTKDSSRRMVLKDVWLDSTATTEAEIQDNLFKDIREFAKNPNWRLDPRLALLDVLEENSDVASDDDLERGWVPPEDGMLEEAERMHNEELSDISHYLEGDKFKELFLTISHHHAGVPTCSVAKGSWDRPDLFTTLDEGLLSSPDQLAGSARTSHPNSQRATPIPEDARTAKSKLGNTRPFTPRRRCFSVHAQLGECLHDLSTVGEVMDVLKQILVALRLMFLAGWVHRDISTGNILAFRTPDSLVGKLGDLEYAQRFPTWQGICEPKTGTMNFMAVEMRSGETFYQPPPSRRKARPFERSEESSVGGSTNVHRRKIPLVHTPQHDLESLWWIISWITTNRVFHRPSSDAASGYFRLDSETTIARKNLLRHGDESLERSYRTELALFSKNVHQLGHDLYCAYLQRKSNVADPNTYAGIHNRFWQLISCLDSSRDKWGSVKVGRLSKVRSHDNE